MKIWKCLVGLCCVCVLGACSKDDGRDDTRLDMSYLTGKDWLYNAWLGDKYGFGSDLLEVLRFEKGGTLKTVDFGGRQEHIVGKWYSEGNKMTMVYGGRDSVVWNVMNSGDDYIRVIVDERGERRYSTDARYLDDLTADAFLVNEYTSGNRFLTRIGVDVRGNVNVREGALLTAAGKSVGLENHGYYWTERTPAEGDYFDFDDKSRDVRFYLRIGKDTQLKLRDSVYAVNLPERMPSAVNLSVSDNHGTGDLMVAWSPYASGEVYYQVEVFSKNMDLMKLYFVSRIQPAFSSGMTIKATTAGDVNRIGEMTAGGNYIVRLTALLYEQGIDVINDEYSYANVQAITYFTKQFIWE